MRVFDVAECGPTKSQQYTTMGSSRLVVTTSVLVVVSSWMVGTVVAFCPYGCGCDETNSRVTCLRSELEVREGTLI